MLIEWFLSIKSLPNLLFGLLCLPGDQSHTFAQPTINPLACCICWAGLLVFPPWNEGPNSGSYTYSLEKTLMLGKIEGRRRRGWQRMKWLGSITDSIDMSLSKLQEMVKDREACHAAVHGVAKSQTQFCI